MSESLAEQGVHVLTHVAEAVGAAMVIGGAALMVVRSMLKGMDKRVKEHIDAATETLIPNGGDSVGDLPAAVKNLGDKNAEEHGEIRDNLTRMDSKNAAEHALIKSQLDDHKSHTDARINDMHDHQQTLIERLMLRHPPDDREVDK